MTVLFQNRTISLILMVPDVEVIPTSLSDIVEGLDQLESSSGSKHELDMNNEDPPSVPVYHGSIIRIEQHRDDKHASDLIIRVPNFQHLSTSPATNNYKPPVVAETESKRLKRRAPLCPIVQSSVHRPVHDGSSHSDDGNVNRASETAKRMWDAARLTTGLRSLSRAFTSGCKPKRSTSIGEWNFPPLLPDVEVMLPKLEVPITPRKMAKQQDSSSSNPKSITPKILRIKRKHFKIKKKQPMSIGTDQSTVERPTSATVTRDVQIDKAKKQHSPIITTTFIERFVDTFENQQVEQPAPAKPTREVEQASTDVVPPKLPIPTICIESDSSSIHRYSTISTLVPDQPTATDDDAEEIPSTVAMTTTTGVFYRFDDEPTPSINPNRPFHIQTSILQPDISVIRYGISDLTTGIDRLLPEEQMFSNEQIDYPSDGSQFIHVDIERKEEDLEEGWYGMVHQSEDTFAEFYEVTYEVDTQREIDLYPEKERVYLANIPDQSYLPLKINIDPLEYKGLASALTNCLPIFPIVVQSEHFESDSDRKQPQLEKANSTPFDSSRLPKSTTITRDKCRSIDDLTRIDNDSISAPSSSDSFTRHCALQRSHSYNGLGIYVSSDVETRRQHFIHDVEQMSPGEDAGLKANDRILCINGTSVVDEDYTVVLQLIKHGLQTDTLDFDVITNAQTS